MKIEVDLISYGPLANWTPQLGDIIFKDGIFSRWCAVIDGINNNNLSVRIAGNPRLLASGDYKNKILNCLKIKNAIRGAYFVVTKDGIYYV